MWGIDPVNSLDRITQAAEELSKGTGNTCIPAQADVRRPDALKEAVRKTVEKFGRIDFVICGESKPTCPPLSGRRRADQSLDTIGAAGNFLVPLSGLSENAFKTVVEIDTVRVFPLIRLELTHIL